MTSTFLLNYIRDWPILLDPDVNVYYAMVLTMKCMIVSSNNPFLNILNLFLENKSVCPYHI